MACETLKAKITVLNSEIAELQKELATAGGTEKTDLENVIREAKYNLSVLQADYDECLAANRASRE
jgi:hypothetical protein